MSQSRRVALVTGAGTGIGRAVAVAVANSGYAVVMAGRRRKPLVSTINAAPRSSLMLNAPVRFAATTDTRLPDPARTNPLGNWGQRTRPEYSSS